MKPGGGGGKLILTVLVEFGERVVAEVSNLFGPGYGFRARTVLCIRRTLPVPQLIIQRL